MCVNECQELWSEQIKELHLLMTEGINSGEVQPLPATVYAASVAEDAFRYMSKGKPRPPAPLPSSATPEYLAAWTWSLQVDLPGITTHLEQPCW